MGLVAGRYELVEQVRADLWRAISHGAAGFQMQVALQELTAASVPHYVRAPSEALHHPNVVQIYDLCELRGRHYLVTEWVDGVSLAELLKAMRFSRTPMPWPILAVVTIGALRALEVAHDNLDERGQSSPLVHAHLSPRSVLVSTVGSIKLTPFGDHARPRRPSNGHYVSPELATLGLPTPSSDLYALGTLLWEMLTGAPPFEFDEDLLGVAGASTLDEARPDVPRPMVAAIERAIAYASADRFPSATAMAAELAAIVADHQWQRGPRQDVGRLVIDARDILARRTETFSNPELELVEEGDDENPMLLTNVTAVGVSAAEVEVVGEDPDAS